jgi:PAS domain S-box-containing protein
LLQKLIINKVKIIVAQFDQVYECDDPQSCLDVFARFNDIPWPITVADMSLPDSPLVYANAAFNALTGYSPEETLGFNCRFMGGKDTDKETLKIIGQALQERKSVEVELLNYRKDGSQFWNLLRLYPLKTRNPALDYFIGLQIDISNVIGKLDRKTSVLDLHHERLATIGAMSAGVAHEINNPIFGVILNLDYVREQVTDTNLIEALDQSLFELGRVSKIVKSLLLFSRKKEVHKNQKVDLGVLLVGIIDLVKTQARTKGWIDIQLDIQLDIPDIPLLAFANEDSIKQILLNLIMNAIDSLVQDEIVQPIINVRVITCSIEQVITVSVLDNGNGVPSDSHEKIFLPFFTTKKEGHGTGLGLSLASSMALDFGGSLTLDTEHSPGAKFDLRIPMFIDFMVQQQLMDFACLESMKSLLGDSLKEVIAIYISELTSTIDEIDALRIAQDWGTLERRVHKLKGSSLGVCSHGMAHQCVLYRQALNNILSVDEQQVSDVNLRLQKIAAHTLEFLTNYLNKH